MISSLLHLVGLRPRVYYTLTNFRERGQGPHAPPPQCANENSQIIGHLSYMLTLCIQFGVVPDNFRGGVLIPIPNNAECDTTEAKNWKPITVSSMFSKLLDLEECSGHEFSDLQLGFVKGRGTEMATTLLHDVIDYSILSVAV